MKVMHSDGKQVDSPPKLPIKDLVGAEPKPLRRSLVRPSLLQTYRAGTLKELITRSAHPKDLNVKAHAELSSLSHLQ